jgi:glycerophosphoryl diester phosphodiesterase
MMPAEARAIRLSGSDSEVAPLEALLRLAKGRGRVLLEPKTCRDSPPGVTARRIALVKAEGAGDRVPVQSFAAADLGKVARLAPEVPVGCRHPVSSGSRRRLEVEDPVAVRQMLRLLGG